MLGWPVGHSKSPLLHTSGSSGTGSMASTCLAGGASRISRDYARPAEDGASAATSASPHKAAMLDLVDAVDPLAAAIGAVNTVLSGMGSLTGYNTDGLASCSSRRLRSADRRAAMGGWCCSVPGRCPALASPSSPESMSWRWSTAHRSGCQAPVARLGDQNDAAVLALPAERHRALEGADLLVNTTSLRHGRQPALDLDLAALPATAIVADIVYTPALHAAASSARRRGHRTVDGLGMLLHQAKAGLHALGRPRPVVDEATRRLMLAPPRPSRKQDEKGPQDPRRGVRSASCATAARSSSTTFLHDPDGRVPGVPMTSLVLTAL
ncbi:MAG: hypothetical protein R3D28_22460 [Geminicoccaceae bacterium]